MAHNLDRHRLQADRPLSNLMTTFLFAQHPRTLNLALQVPAQATNHAGLLPLLLTLASTYLILPIQIVQTLRRLTNLLGSKNIRPISSVTYVRRSSPVHIIFDHIYARTLTRDPLFATYAKRLSHASMTVNVTKAYIRERKNSSARATFTQHQARVGAVAGGLLVLTLLAVTSDLKRVGYVSNNCSMKKMPSASRR